MDRNCFRRKRHSYAACDAALAASVLYKFANGVFRTDAIKSDVNCDTTLINKLCLILFAIFNNGSTKNTTLTYRKGAICNLVSFIYEKI